MLEVKKNGEVSSSERVEVGELRFVNETIEFDHEMEDIQTTLASAMESTVGRPPELTSIRLHIEGQLRTAAFTQLNDGLTALQRDWPILELSNLATEFEPEETLSEDNPLVAKIEQCIHQDREVTPQMKLRILELLKLNAGRWQ
jgi:hypothetical protein